MQFIDDAGGLARACEALARADVLYIDTEFDSGRDGTQLCLVQITAGDEVYLLDGLRLDLKPLGRAIGAASKTWVLHAGQQDVPLLTAALDVSLPRVFDTQVGWSLVSIEYSTSLAYLKYRLLGLRGEKAHQADDWRRRPLPESQLSYAASDVLHLPALYAKLIEKSAALGRLEMVHEASSEGLKAVSEPPPPIDTETFRNAWQLEPEGQAVLRFLIRWYNGLDESQKEAAPDIKGLFSLASRRPKTLEDLAGLRAVPRRAASIFGRELVAGIRRASESAGESAFVPIEPPPYATAAELLAAGWLEAARAEVCTELSFAPELVLPGRWLKKLRDAAVAAGRLEGALDALRGFREQLLREPLREKLRRHPALPALR